MCRASAGRLACSRNHVQGRRNMKHRKCRWQTENFQDTILQLLVHSTNQDGSSLMSSHHKNTNPFFAANSRKTASSATAIVHTFSSGFHCRFGSALIASTRALSYGNRISNNVPLAHSRIVRTGAAGDGDFGARSKSPTVTSRGPFVVVAIVENGRQNRFRRLAKLDPGTKCFFAHPVALGACKKFPLCTPLDLTLARQRK